MINNAAGTSGAHDSSQCMTQSFTQARKGVVRRREDEVKVGVESRASDGRRGCVPGENL